MIVNDELWPSEVIHLPHVLPPIEKIQTLLRFSKHNDKVLTILQVFYALNFYVITEPLYKWYVFNLEKNISYQCTCHVNKCFDFQIHVFVDLMLTDTLQSFK